MISNDDLINLGFTYLDEDKDDDTYPSGYFTISLASKSGVDYVIEYVWQYKYAILKNQYSEEIRLTDIKTKNQVALLISLIKG